MEQHSTHSKPTNLKPVLSPTMRLQLRQRRRKNQIARTDELDWEAIRSRMATIGQSVELKVDPTQLLRERANELARPIEGTAMRTTNTLVVLQRTNCQLALEVEYVREIIPLEKVTYVPGVPEFIAGVINARGKILTLVDLEIFLRPGIGDLKAPPETGDKKQTAIMLETGSFEFGVLCDNFPIIGQHNPAEFGQVYNISLSYRNEYLKGIGPEGVLLVNLLALVADSQFLVEQE